MTTTISTQGNIPSGTKLKRYSSRQRSFNPSFKADAGTIITEAKDKAIMRVFSQHYGNIGDRIGEKLHKLVSQSEILKKSSRFSKGEGALLITDKKVGRSILENIIFPFVNLPLSAASAVLKKTQSISGLKEKSKSLYDKPFLRIPRKLNELDCKTDILKGIFEKTEQTIAGFAKEKGIDPAELLQKLNNPEQYKGDEKLISEASDYIKENLYKVSNKFFDKHTGNFNTAYERPLNRIVTGLIPVAFLANDAYNLSVLCGDKKEVSKKEANERKKQEIIRIFTTAYIQLLTFGAFTKQVNTIPWFAPVTSAATVLISEIFSRRKLGKPVFFLSKDKAKEYNNKNNKNGLDKKNNKAESNNGVSAVNTNQTGVKTVKTSKYINDNSDSSIFKGFNNLSDSNKTSFRAKDTKNKGKKEESKKALINFKTFKKAVFILTGAFFTLSFLKNSSLTKNSKPVKFISSLGQAIKKKFYDPIAYKDFEISTEKFEDVMQSLKDSNCEKIAEGHEFIRGKYSKQNAQGMIKMYKASLDSVGTDEVISAVLKEIQAQNGAITKNDAETISKAIKTAIGLGSADIAERKYAAVAKKAMEILENKKICLSNDQTKALEEVLEETITKEIAARVKETPVKIATGMKPFIDILTEPFKFIYSAARLPFKFVKAGISMLVSPIEKKAALEALGKAELTGFEKTVHKAVTQIFGETKGKTNKISQVIFANAMEQLEKKTLPYREAEKALQEAIKSGKTGDELEKLKKAAESAKQKLMIYVNTAVEKSFNGITQSSNKNTDLALMSKLASSTVTSAFLVADNYNMVMLKSDGEDKDGAKEKANERIIQRLSGLFYQALFINWFNATFRSTYNSSLAGMTAVAIPNTLTTEVLTRKSIGMPVGKKTIDELNEIDKKNENRKGFLGKYFEFMRLLTGKKPLKDRLPKNKLSTAEKEPEKLSSRQTEIKRRDELSTNFLEIFSKK